MNINKMKIQDITPYLKKDISKDIFIFDCLESTNETAKTPEYSKAKHGTIIIADTQTAGKGRMGRTFLSPPNCGLYITFILHPDKINFTVPTLITAFAAVAVCEAIEKLTDKKPHIKWVNDIYLDTKKICGILTESVNTVDNTKHIILGIGINITPPPGDFPPELQSIAGTVFARNEAAITKSHLTGELINNILFPVNQYDENETLTKYKQRMPLLGKMIGYTQNNTTQEATATDIDSFGRLVVTKSDGTIDHLSSGEISIKPDENLHRC